MIAAREAIVCDTSVLAALLFGESGSAQAYEATRSRRLVAPTLLRYELAHVAVRKCALPGAEAQQVQKALAAGLRLRVRLLEPSWLEVFRIAREQCLTAYDASYLQLALELKIPLVTLDRRLHEVAEGLGAA